MSSPREAVYDVLLSKRRRADAEAARLAAIDAEWQRYEADNETADLAYRRTVARQDAE